MNELYRVEVLTRAGWHVRRHLTSKQVAAALNLVKREQHLVLNVRMAADPVPEAPVEPPEGPYADV